MKKTIRIDTSYLAGWMRDYYLGLLSERFDFVEDSLKPDYVLVGTSQQNWVRGGDYVSHRIINDFPSSAIRIYLQHEAVGFDTTLYDYAVLFTDDLRMEDRVFFANFLSAGYFQALGHDVLERLHAPKGDPEALLREKTAFCNFIYSHGGVPEREILFDTLSRHGFVESHGKMLNNINPEEKRGAGSHYRKNWFDEGIELKRPSKFSIAAENALHPKGYYISEKIVTAMLANTIPVYWGNPGAGARYNSRSFVNCHDFESFDAVLERVIEIDNDDSLWCEMMAEPWMTPEQYRTAADNRDLLKEFLIHIFDPPLEEARRRPRGFWPGRYESAKKSLLADAAKYREQNRIDVPALREQHRQRLEGKPGFAGIEAAIAGLRALRRRLNKAQWGEFTGPPSDPFSRIANLAVDSAKKPSAGVKLAIAFYQGGGKWGVDRNRTFSARWLRDLVEGGLLESKTCPSKAYLHWGMMHMTGEPPVVAANPEVALACFAKAESSAFSKVRVLAMYYRAQTEFERGEMGKSLDALVRLLLAHPAEKAHALLIVNLLCDGFTLGDGQRKLLRSALRAETIGDIHSWEKPAFKKLPWGLRRKISRIRNLLEKQGYFAAKA